MLSHNKNLKSSLGRREINTKKKLNSGNVFKSPDSMQQILHKK